MNRTARTISALVLAFTLVAVSCGDDDDSASTTTAAAGEGAVSNIDDVKSATIQVVSKGSFAQPADSLAAYDEYESAGTGSGFIIDPSGLAVTNNHVVTGNASLEVFVGGSDDSVNAKVIGVSECADLALIQLDGGPYPYLEWYDEPVEAGLEVRAAGFPLGDPEYTMTTGIVSKAETNGDTDWASVDTVIEHDANIQPGNSGGPLVEAETGQVVAVNYATGDPGTGTAQFFAINSELAQERVEQLEDGDVESLGVNGVAILDEEDGIAGVWVSGVDTNSPAGELGLQGGDIIQRIEGLTLGTDGTLKDYCDILQSRQPDDKLAVQVLRFEDEVILTGEFNGDELTESESFATIIEEETGGSLESGEAYSEYTEITDNTGSIRVEVPTEWADQDLQPSELQGNTVPRVAAAPDLAAFLERWSAPGMSLFGVGAENGTDTSALLRVITQSADDACDATDPEPYDDGLYTGLIQVFTDCGGTGAVVLAIAAQPEDQSFTALVTIQIASEADIAVADKVIETFIVDV